MEGRHIPKHLPQLLPSHLSSPDQIQGMKHLPFPWTVQLSHLYITLILRQ